MTQEVIRRDERVTAKEIEEIVQDAIWEEICCGWEVDE